MDIHRYLMKETIRNNASNYQKMFIVLLTSLVNASSHTECALLKIQKYKIQSTLINLHPNECS